MKKRSIIFLFCDLGFKFDSILNCCKIVFYYNLAGIFVISRDPTNQQKVPQAPMPDSPPLLRTTTYSLLWGRLEKMLAS